MAKKKREEEEEETSGMYVPRTSYWCRNGLLVNEGFLVRLVPFFLE